MEPLIFILVVFLPPIKLWSSPAKMNWPCGRRARRNLIPSTTFDVCMIFLIRLRAMTWLAPGPSTQRYSITFLVVTSALDALPIAGDSQRRGQPVNYQSLDGALPI